jgi:HAD superfamily hydrolase (TIGR01549 family)
MDVDRIEAVLLDMGGVLIPEIRDFDGAARQPELVRELRSHGISEPEAFIARAGSRLREAYRALEAERGQPDAEAVFADLDDEVRRLLLLGFAREETQPPFPHAREIVRALARDYRLGLVSNTIVPGDHHARALEKAGILRFIDASVWSANFGSRKPGPAIIEHVLEKLDVSPRNAVFVGDKIRTDVAGAHSVGIRAVWLRRPHASGSGEAVPDFVIGHLRELPALLESLR